MATSRRPSGGRRFPIGPAKVETFELFWKGKPQRNPFELLRACCTSPTPDFGVATPSGIVLRAGLSNISIRYCHCSVFDECWLGFDQFGKERDLHPPRVRYCPRPDIPYDNTG